MVVPSENRYWKSFLCYIPKDHKPTRVLCKNSIKSEQTFLNSLIRNFTDFSLKPIQVLAELPTGNAVKDPNAILRNALPIKQVELQELQHKLEETSDLVRRKMAGSIKLLQNVNLY